MSDAHPQPEPRRDDVLAELEAEVAHELEEHRPPPGGPAYQTVAALVGIIVPIVLDHLDVDPADASAIFVTATTDATGVFAWRCWTCSTSSSRPDGRRPPA